MLIAVLALATASLSFMSSRHLSATFDEIILVAGGVRGVQNGRWDMVTDQPPLMMYAYGIAAGSANPVLPGEDRPWLFDDRWEYARRLFFTNGNDPQQLLGRARVVSSVMAGLLVASAGLYAWWIAGPLAGVLGAGITALLPDVLGHGGVAYNDLPLALAFLLALWALDVAARGPSPRRGVLAGIAVVGAFGMKLSALALVPVAGALLAAAAWERREDRIAMRQLLVGAVAGGAVAYVGFVLLYRGDPALTLLRFNFWRTVLHTTGGHESPAYLLGNLSATGWWYYYPVAFFLKTPIGLQALVAAGAVGLLGAFKAAPGLARIVAWRGRSALLGVIVFGGFLMRSDLNAGFRYALPILAPLAVVAAAGLVHVWRSEWRPGRAGVTGLIGLQAIAVLSFYPFFISFSSVWAGGRDVAHESLVDSNIDWGQGLLELRRFMEDEGAASVRLSYFGSAPPEAYGIEYVALPSFFRLSLQRTPRAEPDPRFTVISATNLHGVYLQGMDPFAQYRSREPYRVLAHSLLVYEES
jgi:Co/Zn/Cd efflux system component